MATPPRHLSPVGAASILHYLWRMCVLQAKCGVQDFCVCSLWEFRKKGANTLESVKGASHLPPFFLRDECAWSLQGFVVEKVSVSEGCGSASASLTSEKCKYELQCPQGLVQLFSLLISKRLSGHIEQSVPLVHRIGLMVLILCFWRFVSSSTFRGLMAQWPHLWVSRPRKKGTSL